MAIRRYESREDLYGAVQVLLGMPVNNVEVDIEQYEANFNSCFDQFVLEGYGDGGSYEAYSVVTIPAYTSAITTSALGLGEITAVKDFSVRSGLGNVNQLFTAEHNILTDQNGKFRLFNNDYSGNTPGLELASYEGAMQYLKLTSQMLSKEYTASLREMEQELLIRPTPKTDITGLLTYVKRETELNIMNNVLFRDLFKAAIKRQLGENLGKYSISLPGSGSVNYDRIISDAKEEYKEALDRIKQQAFPPEFSIY